MHIEKYKHNSKYYLRLVSSVRTTSKNGKSFSGKKLVLSLGAFSNHDDGKPDYLERLRESFRNGTPLIKELEPYVESPKPKTVSITFTQGTEECIGKPKMMAQCILDPVFSALGLDQLFASVKFNSKIQYDLQGIVRLLTYGRLLNPMSKSATMEQNEDYFRPPVSSSNVFNVYSVLDVIENNFKQIITRMNTCISAGIGRNPDLMFYDVTNFFFEIDRPDGDIVEEVTNKVLHKGLRKMGVSKENRNQPIVQVGLFLDDNGIPVSFEMFPGNTLDHNTLRPSMSATVDKLAKSRYVLVADRGMYTGTNMCHVVDAGNGYIISKSLRKSTKQDIQWTLDPNGYVKRNEDFKIKSRIVEIKTVDEKGQNRTLKHKVVVYWSRNFYEREKAENASFMEFVEKLKNNPTQFRVTCMQSKTLRKFMKKKLENLKTGEIVNSSDIVAQLDEDKLKEFNDLMGYYQIVTSELDMPDTEVVEKYHGLTQIEDQFREMKSTLETRPVFVRTEEHVKAHLTICFIALTMMRLIQWKVKQTIGEDEHKNVNWSYGIPGERLRNALRDWESNKLPGDNYQMLKVGGEDIKTIFKAFGIEIAPMIYRKGDIRNLKAKVKLF